MKVLDTFVTFFNLNQQKEAKHEGIRYPCDQCEFAATITCNFNHHKASTHKGIRNLCDQCEFASFL